MKHLLIQFDIWGKYACFTPPYAKVERLSSPIPTPSAMRGVLDSIYVKPEEFHWEIRKIEIMNPIKYTSFLLNELKFESLPKGGRIEDIIYIEDGARTQRQTTVLKDVYYRITAEAIPRSTYPIDPIHIIDQAKRRIEKGQCFSQPYLGLRNFSGFFGPVNNDLKSIDETSDYGFMTYDLFDFTSLSKFSNNGKVKPSISIYHCKMNHGVIIVPPYDSTEVIKSYDSTEFIKRGDNANA